jgi:sugar (pentulose or hexulose) kinase
MGIESPAPVTTSDALKAGFSNELGANGTVRFLKNISGLWLIQECKRQWELEGEALDYSQMGNLAGMADPFTAFIDPDDPYFSSPGQMSAKIAAWCGNSGQPVPRDKGTILRIATESLALSYRAAFENIQTLIGRSYPTLHLGGGGIQNQSLCQATADALGIEVIAGPVEATSCGNVIIQMLATGGIESLDAGRDLIQRSFAFKSYHPHDTEAWNAAYGRVQATWQLGLTPPPVGRSAVGPLSLWRSSATAGSLHARH